MTMCRPISRRMAIPPGARLRLWATPGAPECPSREYLLWATLTRHANLDHAEGFPMLTSHPTWTQRPLLTSRQPHVLPNEPDCSRAPFERTPRSERQTAGFSRLRACQVHVETQSESGWIAPETHVQRVASDE